MNIGKWIRRSAIAVSALLIATGANAAPINFSAVKSGVGPYGSYATDVSTGRIYRRDGFNGGTTVQVYNSEADLIADNVAQTVTLASGFYGTYFAVDNGVIYGRTASSGTSVARWDANTGSVLETRASIPGMGGSNGLHTFNWGGFSGVNWMNDSSGLYLMGRNSTGTDWQINKMTPGDLSTIAATANFTPTTSLSALGYGFVINGTMFLGGAHSSDTVSMAVDAMTGALSTVNFTLTGLGAPFLYLSQFSYDYGSDTLYAFNNSSGTLFKAEDASIQFGVAAVSEPGTIFLLGLLLLAFTVSRHRRMGVRVKE